MKGCIYPHGTNKITTYVVEQFRMTRELHIYVTYICTRGSVLMDKRWSWTQTQESRFWRCVWRGFRELSLKIIIPIAVYRRPQCHFGLESGGATYPEEILAYRMW